MLIATPVALPAPVVESAATGKGPIPTICRLRATGGRPRLASSRCSVAYRPGLGVLALQTTELPRTGWREESPGPPRSFPNEDISGVFVQVAHGTPPARSASRLVGTSIRRRVCVLGSFSHSVRQTVCCMVTTHQRTVENRCRLLICH